MKLIAIYMITGMLSWSSWAQAAVSESAVESLAQVIAARSDSDKARDAARHPATTIAFFRIEPGMVVAEGLPGKGWYSNILANYLGSEGTLYGINYMDRMWPLFGFMSDDQVKENMSGTAKFPRMIKGFTDNGVAARGFTFNTTPSDIAGTVDRVILIRAIHNLNRFEANSGTLSQALATVRAILKEDGLVGVVQHRLAETAATEGADGSRGYMKKSDLVSSFKVAGFELIDSSEMNANPKDLPSDTDLVWRLPPTLMGSKDNAEQSAAMQAIGESDRMTLLFRKVP